MKTYNLKIIRIFAVIILTCMLLISLFHIVDYIFIPKYNQITILKKPIRFHGVENSYYLGKCIYVTDSARGLVQVFDTNGYFKAGYNLPTNGGKVWFGTKDDILYCYCVRTDSLFELLDAEIINHQIVDYSNPESFTSDNELAHKHQIDIKKIETFIDDDTSIVLDANASILPLPVFVVLFFVCLFTILQISGVFSKIRFRAFKKI